jgi:hypothetical protein
LFLLKETTHNSQMGRGYSAAQFGRCLPTARQTPNVRGGGGRDGPAPGPDARFAKPLNQRTLDDEQYHLTTKGEKFTAFKKQEPPGAVVIDASDARPPEMKFKRAGRGGGRGALPQMGGGSKQKARKRAAFLRACEESQRQLDIQGTLRSALKLAAVFAAKPATSEEARPVAARAVLRVQGPEPGRRRGVAAEPEGRVARRRPREERREEANLITNRRFFKADYAWPTGMARQYCYALTETDVAHLKKTRLHVQPDRGGVAC